jgi:fructuronate reductase
VLVAPRDPHAVVAALADPAAAIVSLTVTEKGYYRSAETGSLQADAPEMAADLRGDPPQTIYGIVAASLAVRRAAGLGGLTLLSCDNLAANGRLLRTLLLDFLERRDPPLAAWAEANVAFPGAMVDRIVPATTADDIALVESLTGVRDEALVVTEPFSQWVIEDRFAGPRPNWELGGAQFVDDVAPFELAKLRLLNGSHSTLAYVGLALGHEHVHQAIGDEDVCALMRSQMQREVAPSLPSHAGLDPDHYGAAIVTRFANPDLPHRLSQIAMDGSQKIPQRWLATIAERAARGEDSPHHLLSLTAWLAYVRGRSADGAPYRVDDPLAQRLASAWAGGSRNLGDVVHAIVGASGLVPLPRADPGQLERLTELLREWLERGGRSTLRRHLAEERADG